MESFAHDSVLLPETLAWLKPQSGKVYADATLGGGGHTAAILDASAPLGRFCRYPSNSVSAAMGFECCS